ncbi:MAG TPA: hypothetical protein ENK91_13370 [Bacteroidetes bacterium]|nr:hypothetical protein [Bacteroidota bacterium]
MTKIKRVKDKLLRELEQLSQSRQSIEDYHFNFLENFYQNSKLMHSFINKETDKAVLEIAYRQYFVFLISCWETYFRDVFILIHMSDENLKNKLLEKFDIYSNVQERLNDKNIELIELLTKQFNFQNMDKLNEAFSDLISEDDFLKYLCNLKIPTCGINGKTAHAFSIQSIFEDSEDLLNRAFTIRHKVVHDANYRPKFNIVFIQKVEALFLLVPQVTTYLITKKFNLERIIFFNGETNIKAYIFSMQEILSDDWQIKN